MKKPNQDNNDIIKMTLYGLPLVVVSAFMVVKLLVVYENHSNPIVQHTAPTIEHTIPISGGQRG